MIDSVVFLSAEGCVACECVVWTMPVVLESWRALLKDLTAALGADDIISKAPHLDVLPLLQRYQLLQARKLNQPLLL
jgi:hypothetical protein